MRIFTLENDIIEKLRLYALDLHIMGGFNKYSQAMSDAADLLEKQPHIADVCRMFIDRESRFPNSLIAKQVKELYGLS